VRIPTVYPFHLFNTRRKGRKLKPPNVRDTLANARLQDAFRGLGFQVGTPVLNFPPTEEELEAHQGNPPMLVIEDSYLGRGDRVLATTRLPKDDKDQADKLQIERGFTSWEGILFRLIGRYLKKCSRSQMTLHEDVAAALPAAYANRADLHFNLYRNANYRFVQTLDYTRKQEFRGDSRTAAFLIHFACVDELREAGVVLAWGQGATETLVWCHRLSTDLRHLLETPGFVMVEMSNLVCPTRPTGLGFADQWKIDLVLQLDEARRRGQRPPGPPRTQRTQAVRSPLVAG
jgi:hypothetical protein